MMFSYHRLNSSSRTWIDNRLGRSHKLLVYYIIRLSLYSKLKTTTSTTAQPTEYRWYVPDTSTNHMVIVGVLYGRYIVVSMYVWNGRSVRCECKKIQYYCDCQLQNFIRDLKCKANANKVWIRRCWLANTFDKFNQGFADKSFPRCTEQTCTVVWWIKLKPFHDVYGKSTITLKLFPFYGQCCLWWCCDRDWNLSWSIVEVAEFSLQFVSYTMLQDSLPNDGKLHFCLKVGQISRSGAPV